MQRSVPAARAMGRRGAAGTSLGRSLGGGEASPSRKSLSTERIVLGMTVVGPNMIQIV